MKQSSRQHFLSVLCISLILCSLLSVPVLVQAQEELLMPTSAIDSSTVRWLKKNSDEKPNEYYALRWETMGKRRYYKPRETPVKPSVMRLYKFSKELK